MLGQLAVNIIAERLSIIRIRTITARRYSSHQKYNASSWCCLQGFVSEKISRIYSAFVPQCAAKNKSIFRTTMINCERFVTYDSCLICLHTGCSHCFTMITTHVVCCKAFPLLLHNTCCHFSPTLIAVCMI